MKRTELYTENRPPPLDIDLINKTHFSKETVKLGDSQKFEIEKNYNPKRLKRTRTFSSEENKKSCFYRCCNFFLLCLID